MASNTAWVIAVPAENKDAQQTRRRLDDSTAARGLSTNFKFRIPKLKVGTIDTLIALSDDLTKLDSSMNGLVKKIKRTFDETRKAEPSKLRPEERVLLSNHSGDPSVEDLNAAAVPQTLLIGEALGADPHGANQAKTPREAFFKFRWNRYVFNESDSIDALRLKIVDDFAKSDEELRRLLSEFNEIKGLVSAQERKENGSILVRPISRFLRPEVVVETAHLTTLFLAVPKLKEQEFLDSYMHVEQWAADRAAEAHARAAELEAKEREKRAALDKAMNTVPAPAAAGGAAHGAAAHGEHEPAAATTGNVERFKAVCRDHRWTVRPFKFDPHEDDRNRLLMAELVNKRRARWEHLLLWCESQFEEAFVAWMHVVAMRVYVEAILRYGLSTEWIAALLLPNKGSEKKLRDALGQLYAGLGNSSLIGAIDASEVDVTGLGGGQEYFPYVYVGSDLTDL